MRKRGVFIIGRRVHINVGKARAIRKRDMVTTGGDNTLETAGTPRSLMDMSTKGTKLGRRVDGVAFAIVCILMHENDDRTAMSLDVAGSGNERKIEDSAIANTADVGLVEVGGGDNTDIGAGHPAISTSVHQRARGRSRVMGGQLVLDICRVDTAVVTTIDLDKTSRCTRRSS